MSTYTVARDDFKNAARSYIVLGVVGVFAALCGVVFLSEMNIYDDPYRTLFDVSAFVAFVFPLFLAPLAYLSITGDRTDGVIKYTMGLPNTRLEYFVGKLGSRLSVGVAAVVLGMVVSFVVAAATFVNAPSIARFATFTGLALVYTFSFVGLFVAVSASTGKRSRAMLGVFGLYFLLVPFWFGFFPVISITNLIETVASLLGVTVSENARQYIITFSPATAYLRSTDLVYHGVAGNYDVFAQTFRGEELYDQPWFNVLEMLAWGVVGLVVGYVKFDRSELG